MITCVGVKMKNGLVTKSLSLMAMIALSTYLVLVISTEVFASETKIYVTPQNNIFNADIVPVNSTFSVNVSVINGVNVWNWQVNFTFDPSLLQCVSAIIPSDSPFLFPVAPDPYVDNDNGYVLIGASKLGTQPPINASGTLTTITLKIIKAPTTSTPLTCPLNLAEGTRLKDNKMQDLPATLEPGHYEYYLPLPYIEVRPSQYNATLPYEQVTFNIYVGNVSEKFMFIGFQFVLRFNQSLIEPIGYTAGTFMESFKNNGEDVLYVVTYDYLGDPALPEGYNAYVVGVMLLPNTTTGQYYEPYPEGGGLLISLHFNATYCSPSDEIALTDISFWYLEGNPFFPEDNIGCYALTQNMNKIEFETMISGCFRSPIYDENPPMIGNPTQIPSPDNVQENQEVRVLVNVTDDITGVKTVILSYKVNDEPTWHNITMSFNETSGLWEATIPGQPLGTLVKYFIIAYDYAGNVAVNDNELSYFVFTVIPEFSSILVLITVLALSMVAIAITRRKTSKFLSTCF
jgi:hypothetical protein